MKQMTNNELRNISGGAVTYWYTTNTPCTYVTKSKNYFAEPLAYARAKAHKRFCSLCAPKSVKVTYSHRVPDGKIL